MTEKKLRLYHVKGKIVNEYAVAENQMEAIDNVLCHPCDHAIIREMISVKYIRDVYVKPESQ